MKLPKLKYYYYAMSPEDYVKFELSRELTVSAQFRVDVITGTVSGRTVLILADSVAEIDEHFRRAHRWSSSVYVLRIPRDLVDRDRLLRASDHLYEYRACITIPHCGVERVEPAEITCK